MSRIPVSESLRALILEKSFSSEELDDLMQCIAEELEQDSINIIAVWEKESQKTRQNTYRAD